ncbi:MAG TPA: TolC family protein [Polyangiales bacterium]|nr:TolC family protein [Polyangiales bacterium]
MTRTLSYCFACLLAFSAIASRSAAQTPAENPAAEAAAAAAPAPEPLIGPPVAGGLTADHVARRASETSHELRAKREESAAAEYSVDQARAGFIPHFRGMARYSRLSSVDQPSLGNLPDLRFDAPLNQYSLTASLQLPLSDYALRLPQLYAAAQHNARAAELLEKASLQRIATSARVVYYSWARARLQLEVAERSLAQAQGHLKDAQTAQAVGTASRADVLAVESQVASAELMLARAKTADETYEHRLRVTMHDNSGSVYELGEDLRVVPELPAAAHTEERSLVARAWQQRLEPKAMQESAGALKQQAKAQFSANLPRLDAVGNAQYANPNQRMFPPKDEFKGTWDASLQLSWTPSDIFGNESGRSVTLSKARQLEAERAKLNDDIELEIHSELASLRETESALKSSERGLASAEESYRVRRAMFQNGAATSVELTDAESELSRAQMEVIGARIDRRIAEARLLHALGDVEG